MGTIAVVGATGTIGSRVVSALAAAGEEVRAIARRPAGAGEHVQVHVADLTDADAAIAALDGASAVYRLSCSFRDHWFWLSSGQIRA